MSIFAFTYEQESDCLQTSGAEGLHAGRERGRRQGGKAVDVVLQVEKPVRRAKARDSSFSKPENLYDGS